MSPVLNSYWGYIMYRPIRCQRESGIYAEAALEQCRVRVLTPLPHVLEHGDHVDHSAQSSSSYSPGVDTFDRCPFAAYPVLFFWSPAFFRSTLCISVVVCISAFYNNNNNNNLQCGRYLGSPTQPQRMKCSSSSICSSFFALVYSPRDL